MVEEIRLFKVVDMVKRTGIDKHGEVKQYYDVYFETKSGIRSNVTVPADMSKEEIEKVITAEAEKIEHVVGLKK